MIATGEESSPCRCCNDSKSIAFLTRTSDDEIPGVCMGVLRRVVGVQETIVNQSR
jgi:hypothetical protein